MKSNDIQLEICGDHHEVAVIRLTRPAKRNALNDALVLAIRDTFDGLPASVRAAVITGDGDHFCAGLDLSELKERDAGQGLHHSRMWHAALERVLNDNPPALILSLNSFTPLLATSDEPRLWQVGVLYNQDGIFCKQTYKHYQTNLHINIIINA